MPENPSSPETPAPADTPALPETAAPEGRPNLAQRFSAGKGWKI